MSSKKRKISRMQKELSKSKSPKRMIGSLVFFTLAAIAFLGVLYAANYDRPRYQSSDTSGTEYEVALVNRVLEDRSAVDETTEGIWRGSMDLEVKILSGRYKGEYASTTNYFSSLYNVRVKEGEKVSVRIDTADDGTYQVSIYNYYRVPQMIGCVMAFVILLIAIGGKKGAKSVLGLAFTLLCILYVLLPLTLKGCPALLITILIVLVCNFLCFYLIDGWSGKTIVASVGSLCGVISGVIFAQIANALMHITTFQMDEAETLLLITSTTKLQLKDLFLCGILIACMGAVMDVGMSITSAIAELHEVNAGLTAKELFLSGMNIGKDAMGTMSNTLILAFAGNSFNMLLMIYSYGVSFQQLMNTDFVAIEVVRSIAGSMGIICTVPITAFIAAEFYGRKKKEIHRKNVKQGRL